MPFSFTVATQWWLQPIRSENGGRLWVACPNVADRFESVQQVREGLRDVKYLADEGIAGVAFLADRLGKPVLIEGPAGTGKTQLAKSVAEMTGARLIRLQCYEGLDESKALYEWNYKKQLLRIQADRHSDSWVAVHDDIFTEEFLLTRPLLEAIRAAEPVVLLIDEVDRVEVETEALLLEILSDYQVSIPELGTITANQIPLVFLTSNNTPRAVRGAQAALPLSARRLSVARARARDRPRQGARRDRQPRRPDRPRRPFDPADGPEEGAERVGDARLGAHAAAAQPRRHRLPGRQGDAAHPPQVPERHHQGGEGAFGRRRLSPTGSAPVLPDVLAEPGTVASVTDPAAPVRGVQGGAISGWTDGRVVTERTRVRHEPGSARLEASDRWGWIGVGAVTGVVAVSWLRFLNTPLGDNHFGRVGGRYALHVRNLFVDGLIGSSWSANWKPYSSVPYAHHPPLLNMLDAAVSWLPGHDPYQVMLAPHLLALLAIPAGAALLRTFGIGWVPTLVSVGAMTATGYYWVHGPIMFDIGPILLLSAVVVRLSRDPEPERRWVALGWRGRCARESSGRGQGLSSPSC